MRPIFQKYSIATASHCVIDSHAIYDGKLPEERLFSNTEYGISSYVQSAFLFLIVSSDVIDEPSTIAFLTSAPVASISNV